MRLPAMEVILNLVAADAAADAPLPAPAPVSLNPARRLYLKAFDSLIEDASGCREPALKCPVTQ